MRSQVDCSGEPVVRREKRREYLILSSVLEQICPTLFPDEFPRAEIAELNFREWDTETQRVRYFLVRRIEEEHAAEMRDPSKNDDIVVYFVDGLSAGASSIVRPPPSATGMQDSSPLSAIRPTGSSVRGGRTQRGCKKQRKPR